MPNEMITSLINSFLPIGLTLLIAWLNGRNNQTRYREIIADAKHRIELINAYVTSQNLVIDDPVELGEIKKTAANELYNIKAFLDRNLNSLEKAKKSSEILVHFFLLYKMQTILAGFFRFLFFVILAASVLWSIFWSSIVLVPTSGVGIISIQSEIIVLTVFILPVILLAVLLRWLAIKFDKPATPTKEVESS